MFESWVSSALGPHLKRCELNSINIFSMAIVIIIIIIIPQGIYLLKVNKKNKSCESLQSQQKTPLEQRHWRPSENCIVNFEKISHVVPYSVSARKQLTLTCRSSFMVAQMVQLSQLDNKTGQQNPLLLWFPQEYINY